jgi:hypothetical protein
MLRQARAFDERFIFMRNVPQLTTSNLLAAAFIAAALAASTGACQPKQPNSPDTAATSAPSAETETTAAPADAHAADQEAARSSSEAWLALVDQAQYGASWDAAAPLFQSSVTKEQWESAVKGARGPLGDLASRKFRAAEYKQSLPGAPDGEYVVAYYDTSFAQKASAVESITTVRTPEGWKVVGYFIQ